MKIFPVVIAKNNLQLINIWNTSRIKKIIFNYVKTHPLKYFFNSLIEKDLKLTKDLLKRTSRD